MSEIKEYATFDTMGLPENLLRGIYAYGFEKPSQIQSLAIVPMVAKRDILGHAQSGTGKTGTFSIGALAQVDPAIKTVQVLVISPVRELAEQTTKVATALSGFMDIQVACVTGGKPVHEDVRLISRGTQFLVGTPGRIYDLLERKAFSAATIRCLILDEADQMLEERFLEQVHCIMDKGFLNTTQCTLFSATMSDDIIKVAKKFLRDPVEILLPPEKVSLDGITQYQIQLEDERYKLPTLIDLYENLKITQAMIYCNTRGKAEHLAAEMKRNGFELECIHGDMATHQRAERMQRFRNGDCRVLISTDLLARGIDVQQVSLVINYELPDRENYIHRIGRTGRYGRKGTSINFVTPKEKHLQDEIEAHYKIAIKPLPECLEL
jgi:translation initiation factor 4A